MFPPPRFTAGSPVPEKFTGQFPPPTFTIDPPKSGDFSFGRSMSGHNARICPVFFACGVCCTNCTNCTPEVQNRSTGVFGTFSAVWSKKAGANTGRTAHSRKPVKTCHFRLYGIPSPIRFEARANREKTAHAHRSKPAQNGHKKRAFLSFAVMYKKARLLTFVDIPAYIKIPSKHERSTEGEPL